MCNSICITLAIILSLSVLPYSTLMKRQSVIEHQELYLKYLMLIKMIFFVCLALLSHAILKKCQSVIKPQQVYLNYLIIIKHIEDGSVETKCAND